MTSGFEPIVYDSPKCLILGSLPSVKSLAKAEYYGHPQNRFWKILSVIYNENIDDYAAKKQLLEKHHIALWDVIKEADREGSSDLKIVNPVPNDIAGIVLKYPTITKILCTGTLSYTLCMKYFSDLNVEIIKLPSPSPANVSYTLEKLVDAYSKYLK